ncbi:MAG TPA: GNAT family N-acetyltransferase [Candidatus Cloacimonetes bacterium]|nr:GNAT family N-acetyltransferase [Candidatus Cloacimonadota bacterium]HEX37923.1 GNAT family N-acetyltransferase [Candidatus Cloacimonadota bacterium]
MNFIIEEKALHLLTEYSKIPIRFEVRSLYEVCGNETTSVNLIEKPVPKLWIKDYDAIKGEEPIRWAKQWDISNWGMLIAEHDRIWIGGCVLAYNTDGVHKLEGRDDITVLWDLRVHPDFRRKGIGKKLFESTIKWAKTRKCTELKIETQNINVPACKFYQKQGCLLDRINRFAYKNFPDEIEMMWSLKL